MNTWGIGSFDNDSAADFVREVVEDGPEALREAFEVALDPDMDYLEAEEGCRVVAAAEIVRANVGGDLTAVSDPELRTWLAGLEPAELADLPELAGEALDRVLAPESELPDLWAESGDHASWLAGVRRLREVF